MEDGNQINLALVVESDYLRRFRGLFESFLVGLLDELSSVTLVCSDAREVSSLNVGPARVLEFSESIFPWRRRSMVESISNELRKSGVNVIHSLSGKGGKFAIDLSKNLGVPYVITFTGLQQEECYLDLEERLCGRLVGISEPICEMLGDLYGKSGVQIDLIRPGCYIRQRSPNLDRAKTLVSVGRFDRHSGYDTLLRSVLQLREEGNEIMVVLFGSGRMESSLRQWVNANGLSKQVIILDAIDNWESVLGESDFYIQPGAFYSLDSGAYLGLSYGCPIISTHDTAMDIVIDGQTGRHFETGNHDDLAGILRDWVEGKFDWNELSAGASRFAQEKLSMAKSLEKAVKVYSEVGA